MLGGASASNSRRAGRAGRRPVEPWEPREHHPAAGAGSGALTTGVRAVTRPEPPTDAEVRAAFEQLGRISFAEHSLDSLIQTVTDLAAEVLPGNAATSVTMLT